MSRVNPSGARTTGSRAIVLPTGALMGQTAMPAYKAGFVTKAGIVEVTTKRPTIELTFV